MYLIIPLVTPPKETLNKIQVDMYKFIWGGRPDKIKRDVVNNSNPAVPRLSFATRFAHIFATGNEIQKYFSARSNSFDL